MNQFHEAALDRQEDRELRRDMADPVFLPEKASLDNLRNMDGPLILTHPDYVMIAAPCHITVDEFSHSFWARVYGHTFRSAWGSCAAAAIREALKA